MKKTLSLILLVLPILFFVGPAYALSSEPQNDDMVTVRLLAGQAQGGAENEMLLGLEVQLAEGWHTYWRSGGDAGLPPTLAWEGSTNLERSELLYPAPHRAMLYGMETIGYKDSVIFPVRATRQDSAQATSLNLALDLLVCKDLCLPKHFNLTLDIPAGLISEGEESEMLASALATVPRKENTPALTITHVERTAQDVLVSVTSDKAFTDPDLFVENDAQVFFSKPERIEDQTPRSVTLKSSIVGALPDSVTLDSLPLVLTLTNGPDALELALAPHTQPVAVTTDTAQQESQTPPHPSRGATILLLALMGGFILNLMPCVLPVLSLKILSVIKHGGGEKHTIRRSFLATGFGIIVSFIALALATIGLQALGHVIGWGVQFQQPAFIVCMIVLLTLFAANLWGFFEISLPRWIMDKINTTHHPRLAGDFATGMLATLLATPCSAPFLGTAVGFALSSSAPKTLIVFAALGLGMALPYMLIALCPRLASSLPKAGNWMIVLTRLLGFGLAGTALWLLFVLNGQMGLAATAAVGAGMLVILAQLFLRHRNILRRVTVPVIALIFAGCFALGLAATVPAALSPEAGVWEKFDEATMQRHVREGKTVFVDITADWCLTCKANKRFTLSQKQVAEKLFETSNIVAMQGDWTNPDPALTAFLRKHGRYGIPFNAVFGPKAPEGILLSELLTIGSVLDALDEASAPHRTCPATLPAGTEC